jgi:hypothetical protein
MHHPRWSCAGHAPVFCHSPVRAAGAPGRASNHYRGTRRDRSTVRPATPSRPYGKRTIKVASVEWLADAVVHAGFKTSFTIAFERAGRHRNARQMLRRGPAASRARICRVAANPSRSGIRQSMKTTA